MTDFKFASRFVELIRFFDSPEQALSAVQRWPVPYKRRKCKKHHKRRKCKKHHKRRKCKKHLKKLIRTYIYITNHKEEE